MKAREFLEYLFSSDNGMPLFIKWLFSILLLIFSLILSVLILSTLASLLLLCLFAPMVLAILVVIISDSVKDLQNLLDDFNKYL